MFTLILIVCALAMATMIALTSRIPDGMPMDILGFFALAYTLFFFIGCFGVLAFATPTEALNLAFLVGFPAVALLLVVLPFALRQTVRIARLLTRQRG